MSNREINALIVGAGKVGRGFIAHLLARAGVRITFIEWSAALVEEMARRGRYHIFITGIPEQVYIIEDYRIVAAADRERIDALVAGADVIFTAIGGERLASLGPLFAPGITQRARQRAGVLNLITCENWNAPGAILRQSIVSSLPDDARGYMEESCGVAESTVYRGCFEPTPAQRALDPLAVQGTDYWELQVDGDRLCPPAPDIPGIVPIAGFHGALERKLFTYSALSAAIAYLGALFGYRLLREAARDQRVLAVARQLLDESGAALCRRHGHAPAEQQAHAEASLAVFQNPQSSDTLERHARDPLRKLGPHDRLIGPASLCLEEGIEPRALALAIAAALRYDEPMDPAAVTLQRLLRAEGLAATLRQVCGLDPHGPLARLITARIPDLDRLIAGDTSH